MNAITPMSLADEPMGVAMPDGSLLVSAEQLSRFGSGDIRRGRRELRLILAAEKDHAVRSGPTEKPKSVRIPTQADEPVIFNLIIAHLKENAASIAPIDTDRVISHMLFATRQQGGIIGVIDGPAGVPVALIMIHPSRWWWSSAYYLQEMVTYVHPDHRRSNHIDDLLQFSKWATDRWTASFGYQLRLLCGVFGTKRIREKICLYRRKFRSAGMAFLYPAPHDTEG